MHKKYIEFDDNLLIRKKRCVELAASMLLNDIEKISYKLISICNSLKKSFNEYSCCSLSLYNIRNIV